MSPRNPDIKRAIVTAIEDEGRSVRVLVDYMRLLETEDDGAIRVGDDPAQGVAADAIPGLEVGDEVLVDLRTLPAGRLALAWFGLPVLFLALGLAGGKALSLALALAPGAGLATQAGLAVLGLVAALRLASADQARLEAAGLGRPVVTALLPRFVRPVDGIAGGEDAYLQSTFPLEGALDPATWSFVEGEFQRMTGVQTIVAIEDRIEIIYHGGILKEKHLFELLITLNVPVRADREFVG